MRPSSDRTASGQKVAVLSLLLATAAEARKADPPAPAVPPAEAARRILGEALSSDAAYQSLGVLCDRIGNRLSGSPGLDKAIAWAQERMRADGLDHVRAEPVMVPVWVRGEERAELVAPVTRPLSMLGLGGSVGTPPEGITAEVVVVSSFEELDKLPDDRIKGRMVLFDAPFVSYGETVKYRGGAAAAAGRRGAVAALIRSISPISFDTPHTGAMRYPPGVPQVPVAALTLEAARALHRMAGRGDTPRVRLVMGAHTLPDAPSANVVGELTGRERPEEIVVVGGHLDSWDVGQGAQDDGVGVVEVMEAAATLKRLGLRPRRTIRVVLFTNEENGLRGGIGYRDAHVAELPRHVAAIESDSGAGPGIGWNIDIRPPGGPRGFGAPPPEAAWLARQKELEAKVVPRIEALMPWLEPLGVTRVQTGHSGADLDAIAGDGVLGIGDSHDWSRYFDVHHSRADTFEKIDRQVLRRNVAALATFAWLLAEVY